MWNPWKAIKSWFKTTTGQEVPGLSDFFKELGKAIRTKAFWQRLVGKMVMACLQFWAVFQSGSMPLDEDLLKLLKKTFEEDPKWPHGSPNLRSVRIFNVKVLPIPKSKDAFVIGHKVFFRKKNAYSNCRESSISLLLHELVHVRQYEIYGRIGFASEYAVNEDGLESEANDFRNRNIDDLLYAWEPIMIKKCPELSANETSGNEILTPAIR